MARISRAAYVDMYGPTVGDRVRLADTDLFIEVEKDFAIPGEEVKFGGGKVIRDGMGQSQRASLECVDCVITNALILDHWGVVKADIGIRGGLHRGHRQGRQSGRAARGGHRHRPGHGGDRRGESHRHARRHRQPHPLHLPPAGLGGPALRRDHHDRRRHRPGRRHQRHHLHPRPLEPYAHAPGRRRPARERGASGQGQRQPAPGPGRAGGGRGHGPQAPRGLGHHPGGHRLLPGRGRGHGRAGGHPHRHPERIRLRGAHHRGVQGPGHPRLPHRGGGRRPRPGHHPGLRGCPTCCPPPPIPPGPTR